jgi:hypothetical protein
VWYGVWYRTRASSRDEAGAVKLDDGTDVRTVSDLQRGTDTNSKPKCEGSKALEGWLQPIGPHNSTRKSVLGQDTPVLVMDCTAAILIWSLRLSTSEAPSEIDLHVPP